MATPSKSAGTSHSSGSEAQTGQIATLRGGFRASEATGRSRIDTFDDVNRRLTQLIALLNSIYGNGFENFSHMSDEMQDNILWLAADLAEGVKVDFDVLAKLEHGAANE